MKAILFRFGTFLVPTEAAPLIAATSGAVLYGLYTGARHVARPEIRKHRNTYTPK
ncbi:hypothetical protein GGI11_004429 [Coemansia sp. RSA 2049]|nr:hypothetical protein GGI11_004429 [Coemansia sp. RSA 2049]